MGTKTWIYSPPKPKVPDAIKIEVEIKAMALVNDFLKPEHIKPPPENVKLKGYIEAGGPPGFLVIESTSNPANFIRRCREFGFEVKPL